MYLFFCVCLMCVFDVCAALSFQVRQRIFDTDCALEHGHSFEHGAAEQFAVVVGCVLW